MLLNADQSAIDAIRLGSFDSVDSRLAECGASDVDELVTRITASLGLASRAPNAPTATVG